jgi:predicted nucleic acid-binding protein
VVIDANVAVAMSLAHDEFPRLRSHPLAAPSLLWSEAASALRQLRWRDEVGDSDSRLALAWLTEDSAIASHDSRGLLDDAWRVAAEFGWAKTYDAEYVALAQRLDVPLVTLDARLRRAAGRVVEVIGPTEA